MLTLGLTSDSAAPRARAAGTGGDIARLTEANNMIDYHAPVDFTATVYTIEGETIRAHILADLVREHCREAPTPLGVMPVFHARGAELWTWGHAGQHPRLVAEFETEKEAEHALLLAHLYDAEQEVHIYYRREDAETDLSDLLTAEEF